MDQALWRLGRGAAFESEPGDSAPLRLLLAGRRDVRRCRRDSPGSAATPTRRPRPVPRRRAGRCCRLRWPSSTPGRCAGRTPTGRCRSPRFTETPMPGRTSRRCTPGPASPPVGRRSSWPARLPTCPRVRRTLGRRPGSWAPTACSSLRPARGPAARLPRAGHRRRREPIRPTGTRGHRHLRVEEAFRRRGLATALLAEAARWLRLAGSTSLVA